MTSHDRINRIKMLATLLIVLAIVFLIYQWWRYLSLIIPLAFTEPGMLQKWFRYPSADIEIPSATRIIYFLATLVPNLVSLVAVVFGARLMMQFRAGAYFAATTISTIRYVGLALVGLAVTSILATMFINPWVTQHNPDGALPINLYISSYDLGYVLAGILVFIIGWVMGEALKIQEENKAFV